MELSDEIRMLSQKGYYCSQIIMILGQKMQGEDNAGAVRAMCGLNGGVGFQGDICGALSGACCLIGYYAGKGSDEETDSDELGAMMEELYEWFVERFSTDQGSCNCRDLINGNLMNKVTLCPVMVEESLNKAMEILTEHGVVE